jgi:hypothetical protein
VTRHRAPAAPSGRNARHLLVVPLATLLLAGPSAALADPAPGSVRVTRTGNTVRVGWQAGSGPYGIYRSPDPADVVRPAWLAGATQQTFYEEPVGAGIAPISYYLVDDPQRCVSNAECDNGINCDGVETCGTVTPVCVPGAPITCNDGDDCTADRCVEATGGCEYASIGCDDGDPCTIDSCRQGGGCFATVNPDSGVGTAAELAGRSLPSYPHFEFTAAANQGTPVELAVDPTAHPAVTGQTCDVYVLAKRSAAAWCAGTALVDVRGAPETRTFVASGVRDNTFALTGSATLSAVDGTAIGRGYDLALDCNRNGTLDAGELADGLSDGPGFTVLRDLTQPGPLAVSQFDDIGPEPPHCSGSGNDDMRIYYPSVLNDPGATGTYPLAVISHGNGHCYDWYDFLGRHLASFGFIAMSHDNNTGPGIETASTTTLQFTDKILAQQATLGGGVLNGHIDDTRIAWIGHSRGGEGVARAYDRLVDEAWPATQYSARDIAVISSIAPTDFLGPAQSDPHGVPYHLLYGSADGDVCGCPNNAVAQSFGLYERATGARQSTYVHGADHNDFNCCGFEDFSGPAGSAIGREEAQRVQKVVQLALLKQFVERFAPAKDIFWRQWEAFRPLGVAAGTVVVNELREPPARRSFVVDDYQAQPAPGTSSSGGAVTATVAALAEQREQETNGGFDWTGSEPMNGMTRGRNEDLGRGVVFEFAQGSPGFYELDVVPAARDFRDDTFLSFRATQMTRHPRTIAALGDLTFTVTLADTGGRRSAIGIGAFGGGIEEPYQRTGYGAGTGWQNEFETVRIRLTDFLRDGANLDLGNVLSIRFDFGAVYGSAEGRVALDDIELVKE